MKRPDNQIKRLNVVLLAMVIVLSAIMIAVNYYTIKILSASRAYINGESQYSKGQKEASGHLITYIYSRDTANYTAFLDETNIPIGDRIAREALVSGDHALAYKGFLQAKNNVSDVNDLVWLFDTFKHVGLFAKAITLWKEGDALIEQLRVIGLSAHSQIQNKGLTEADRDKMIASVNGVTVALTIKERAFSDTLGIVCRTVNTYLFAANIAILIIIIISAVLYTGKLIRNIEYSRERIALQNEHLLGANKELDQLIYSVTHDLRAPLVSLSGLIELIDLQTDIEEVKDYTGIMKVSIQKQNDFIQTILKSAERQNEAINVLCNLGYIIDDVIAQNHTILNGRQIEFIKELNVTDVFCDETKLQAILNNLISNAVKYADVNKALQFVKIRSVATAAEVIIEVEDNGIGISQQNKNKVFDKYFMAQKGENNTGLGLYLVKNMVLQMQGEIEVRSKPGRGSTFVLKLPFAG